MIPLWILSDNISAILAAETFLPGNKSSASNLNEAPKLVLPPIKPLAKAKKEAVDTFLICVIVENTVLPIWPVAFTDINALYKGISYSLPKVSSTPLIAFAISAVVYKPDVFPSAFIPL